MPDQQEFQLHFPILSAFLLLSIVTLFKLWKQSKAHDHSTPNPPPGPWKLPIIGNIHQLVGSLLHHVLIDLAKKYGPVMQLQIGAVPTVVISSAQAAKLVLKTHEDNFVERPFVLVANIMFYNRADIGFAPYGDFWRQMRKVCILELFSAKRVRSFGSIREEEVSNFIKTIYSKAGSPVDLSKMMFDLLIGITTRISIGKKCKNPEALFPILEQMTEAIGVMNVVDLFPSSKFFYMISKVRSRLERLHHEADEILENIVNEHRQTSKQESTESDENIDEVEDLLDVLLNLQKQGNLESLLTTNSIKAIILELFGAGSDTSSTLMEWAMSELLKNPKVMRTAQEEVRQVFRDARGVKETSLHNLKFLKLVIKETMRLHPPAMVLRECNNTCKINGYDIKAGTKIMINVWAIGMDSSFWKEPEKFYPERFLDSGIDYKGTDFELIPFGAGKRMCPGMLLASVSVELSLAKLLYHFDWKLPDGAALEHLDMTETFGGTVRRKHNLNLIPIPYDSSP